MSSITINGSNIGNSLTTLLTCADIQPGDDLSYQLCKTVYLYHPIGAKMTDTPIKMAQSQKRDITVPKAPEQRVMQAFDAEWKRLGADKHIFNLGRLARMYGIASLAMLEEGQKNNQPPDMTKIWKATLSFNAFDPLNTAGSLVLNQNPNAADFQHVTEIVVQGQVYHRSRTVVLLNAQPIYLGYTNTAFGYVGTSVYQRALYPLKSFIKTMVADDMLATKVGVIVAFIKAAGSIANRAMQLFTGQKRDVVKEAETTNVISVTPDDRIESIDLTNASDPLKLARSNIVENIALASDMPAKLLNSETFAEGFGEGTEDAKAVAGYIEGIRAWLEPAYMFFDNIVQHRAWNEEFYATIQADFPEYKSVPFNQFFFDCVNSFQATWPSLLTEPPSELAKADKVKLDALIESVEVLAPIMDPANKARLVQWFIDNMNEQEVLFTSALEFDPTAFEEYEPPAPEATEPKPVSTSVADSAKAARRARKADAKDPVMDLFAALERRPRLVTSNAKQ